MTRGTQGYEHMRHSLCVVDHLFVHHRYIRGLPTECVNNKVAAGTAEQAETHSNAFEDGSNSKDQDDAGKWREQWKKDIWQAAISSTRGHGSRTLPSLPNTVPDGPIVSPLVRQDGCRNLNGNAWPLPKIGILRHSVQAGTPRTRVSEVICCDYFLSCG